jgi:hypothetical protein
MKKSTHVIIGVLVVILVSSPMSYAWNGRGHMMVAAVAYQKLNQATKDRVDALLLLNPDRDNWFDLIPATTSAPKRKMMIFMIAATWADRIKSDPDYHTDGTHNGNRPPNDPSAGQNIGFDDLARHKYWHFVDTPFSEDDTTLPSVPAPNAETQIAKFRAVLASEQKVGPWNPKRVFKSLYLICFASDWTHNHWLAFSENRGLTEANCCNWRTRRHT